MSLTDEDSWQLATNLDRLLLDATWRRQAEPIDRNVLRRWHQVMFEGIALADASAVGVFRGEPLLRDALVFVRDVAPPFARVFGASPEHVASDLAAFESELRRRLVQVSPTSSMNEKAQLAGWVHGELVRIHPFANGNGRIARLAANWVLWRVHAPCVVRLRPRPEGREYIHAACDSMRSGSHERMTAWIEAMIRLERGESTSSEPS